MRALFVGVVLSLAVGLAHTATADVFTVVNNSTIAYTINGVDNPTLNLVKGQTYTFNVSAIGHPFYIKTAQITGTGSQFSTGVTNNGAQNGTVTFVVPNSAPNPLFYNCQFHSGMTGTLNILTPAPGVSPAGVASLVLLLSAVGGTALLRRRRTV